MALLTLRWIAFKSKGAAEAARFTLRQVWSMRSIQCHHTSRLPGLSPLTFLIGTRVQSHTKESWQICSRVSGSSPQVLCDLWYDEGSPILPTEHCVCFFIVLARHCLLIEFKGSSQSVRDICQVQQHSRYCAFGDGRVQIGSLPGA